MKIEYKAHGVELTGTDDSEYRIYSLEKILDLSVSIREEEVHKGLISLNDWKGCLEMTFKRSTQEANEFSDLLIKLWEISRNEYDYNVRFLNQ